MLSVGKGLHQVFLDNGSFTSERVLAFRFLSCPCPLVSWGEKFWFQVLFEIKIFFSACTSAA